MATRKRQRKSKKRGGGCEAEKMALEEAQAAHTACTAEEPVGGNAAGGKRRKGKKTRKMAKGASNWNKQMMKVYHEMKKKDPLATLTKAMQEASRRKKRGEL
jgi:hypothetical protein